MPSSPLGVYKPLVIFITAKCVLNVLFLVADFQPSRCVETYSRAGFHASDRNGVDLVSHSATITVSNQTGLKLCNVYLMHIISVLYAI